MDLFFIFLFFVVLGIMYVCSIYVELIKEKNGKFVKWFDLIIIEI